MPWLLAQVTPQSPQFEVVVSGASQPLESLLSQFPQLVAHVMAQLPFEQLGVPLLELHTTGQLPQWAGSASRLTSHPLPGVTSQSP